MSGIDKKKLIVIGKRASPRCSKEINKNSLPVEYFSNANARMTSEIFRGWIT
jgi:hypothetical protein